MSQAGFRDVRLDDLQHAPVRLAVPVRRGSKVMTSAPAKIRSAMPGPPMVAAPGSCLVAVTSEDASPESAGPRRLAGWHKPKRAVTHQSDASQTGQHML